MVARSHARLRAVPLRGDFHMVIGPHTRRRRITHWVLLSIAGCALFLLLVLSRIALDRHAFVMEDLEGAIATEEARYWELRMDVAELRDPARIARMARSMGMVYPEEVRLVSVPGLGSSEFDIEERWANLKLLLSAQP
jgi:cell division protein FtsB